MTPSATTDRGAYTTTGNRLETFDGFTMTYDADGNLTREYKSGFDQTFSWNSLGQLTAVTTNGATTTYDYDGLGRRVRKTVGGTTTYFLYDGANLVMQLDGAGTPQFEFSYHPGVDNPHAVRRSSDGAVFYYVTEQPGHVAALVDLNNQVVRLNTWSLATGALLSSRVIGYRGDCGESDDGGRRSVGGDGGEKPSIARTALSCSASALIISAAFAADATAATALVGLFKAGITATTTYLTRALWQAAAATNGIGNTYFSRNVSRILGARGAAAIMHQGPALVGLYAPDGSPQDGDLNPFLTPDAVRATRFMCPGGIGDYLP